KKYGEHKGSNNQKRVIYLGRYSPHPDRKGFLTRLHIRLYIPYIIYIQYTYGKKTHSNRRTKQCPFKPSRLQETGSQYTDQTKKDKYEKIAETRVSIRCFSYGIFYRGPNGTNSQQ